MLFFRVGATQGLTPAAERTAGSAIYSSDDDEDTTWQRSAKEREALFDSIFSGTGPRLHGTVTNVKVEGSENVANHSSNADNTFPGQSQPFKEDKKSKKIVKRKCREWS